jgi:hypothetical protein
LPPGFGDKTLYVRWQEIMNKESIAVAMATGRQVIRDEHAFFVKDGVDNSEHVPRIGRIAESVRSILSQEGAASSEANQAKRDLIDFGRALFVKEWMKPIAGDDELPSEKEAVAEFNSYLRKRKQ